MNPHILLVEDDPTTCAYLLALTLALPSRVDTAGSIAEALRKAAAQGYDLWLVDANLPDGNGIELLSQLRRLHADTPALAHTAARDRSELDPLIEAGFLEVLAKPVDADTWRGAIRRALGRHVSDAAAHPVARAASCGKLPVWDDAAAARALGGSDNIAALRGLFLAELPSQAEAIRTGDADTRRHHLHRLRASCAFVGASRLEAAVRVLQDHDDAGSLQIFLDAASDTLAPTAS